MDGNKDEALKCIKIAQAAINSGDKTRALKFIKIAKRLDPNLKIDQILLSPSEDPNNNSPNSPPNMQKRPKISNQINQSESSELYTEENVRTIREIRKNRDYYAILGIEKTSTIEEIKRAYKKLSLKVHPDKNKAPGAEEAFKSVSKAFNCLNNEQSRLNYDQTGSENYNFSLQNDNFTHTRPRRRYYTRDEFFDDEIFGSFFFGSQERVYTRNFPNRRNYQNTPHRENPNNMSEVQNTIILVMLVCILFFFLVASLPFLESEYSLQKSQNYHISKVIENIGVEYFVKREDFDNKFPKGSLERENLEVQVLRDYKGLIGRYCQVEMQRKFWDNSYKTPYCDKLRKFQTV